MYTKLLNPRICIELSPYGEKRRFLHFCVKGVAS